MNINENSASNPEICRIEAYCNTSKSFLGKISLLSTLFHEAVHLGQIGSSLTWRYNALHYSLILLEHFENELLLSGYGAKSFGFNVGDVLRNENDIHKNVSKAFVLLLAQALGKGKTAKNSRNTGKLKINGSDEKEVLEKLNKISIEDSQTSRLLGDVQKEMLSDKISSNKLNFLKKKLKAFMEEMQEISECQAEAFCFVLLKDFLENLPDRRIRNYSPEKICELLISSRIRRGKQSQAYYTAKRRSKTKSEFTAMLRKEGLRYQRCICVKNDIEPIFSLLVSLGYDPLDPMSAYLDMEELKVRAKKAGIRLADCLKPINSAEASSAKTYSANIELILKTIEKFGVKKSFKMILNAESSKEIRSWL